MVSAGMTPAQKEKPLRRSEVMQTREAANSTISLDSTMNDDDAERRLERHRSTSMTTVKSPATESASTLEQTETLKKCLEFHSENKISKENAWSFSVIDTVTALLERHHKSLNNFKVAGSSLEASSKVYGLRVDSVHMDALRMSAGLNAHAFAERNFDDDDDDGVATGGDGANAPDDAAANNPEGTAAKTQKNAKPKKRRKAVSTITKNKETLNARPDTVPLQDPVFASLNCVVGSINSSIRLMNNILLTNDSELMLRTTSRFWDASTPEEIDYLAEVPLEDTDEMVPCDRWFKIQNLEALQLRPVQGGYVISDTPEVIADDKNQSMQEPDRRDSAAETDASDPHDVVMAFDINADCEPLPDFDDQPGILDVDYAELDEDLTEAERTALTHCHGLRKSSMVIEDLRPVDATTQLEYSYRPLDQIARFWAGPSHWKFKRTRARPSTLAAQSNNVPVPNNRQKRAQLKANRRSKQINFDETHDELFINKDKFKGRKINVQKRWDARKLKLPTDLKLDARIFTKYRFAPQQTEMSFVPLEATDINDGGSIDDNADLPDSERSEEHFGDADEGAHHTDMAIDDDGLDAAGAMPLTDNINNANNSTVLEIATDFEGAPSQVTKIIVPFAKRAKVVDMKSLKRAAVTLLGQQFERPVAEDDIPKHPVLKNEQYAPGVASFQEIFQRMPQLLTAKAADAVSPSVALYSVLHVANEQNLRLIPQEELKDFKIRQILDKN